MSLSKLIDYFTSIDEKLEEVVERLDRLIDLLTRPAQAPPPGATQVFVSGGKIITVPHSVEPIGTPIVKRISPLEPTEVELDREADLVLVRVVDDDWRISLAKPRTIGEMFPMEAGETILVRPFEKRVWLASRERSVNSYIQQLRIR